jgi:leader peptidase (prepilin peptidase) / N-methyltransferase
MILWIEPRYWFAYSIFFSALIVTIRTDTETMLISRYATLFLLPLGLVLSSFKLLPISLYQSAFGAVFGYSLLWLIAKLYHVLRKQEGMGEGDFELLAFIGSFTGIVGVWVTLFFGALLGTIVGLGALLKGASLSSTKIPFGPWLALGAIIYTFTQASSLVTSYLHLF